MTSTNHPNRSRSNPGPCSSPAPALILSTRQSLGLTQEVCAELVCYSRRAWQYCETGQRRMHPAAWQLFILKTAHAPRLPLPTQPAPDLAVPLAVADESPAPVLP